VAARNSAALARCTDRMSTPPSNSMPA
jgi:hypothetical protein